MNEMKYHFGFQCWICGDEGSLCWYGRVVVPRWHPVRVRGLDDYVVLMCGDKWVVFLGGDNSFYRTSNACWSVASTLRRMQDDWDRLSPYEREYMIW